MAQMNRNKGVYVPLTLSCYKCQFREGFDVTYPERSAYDAGWRLDMKRGQMCPACAKKRAQAHAARLARAHRTTD